MRANGEAAQAVQAGKGKKKTEKQLMRFLSVESNEFSAVTSRATRLNFGGGLDGSGVAPNGHLMFFSLSQCGALTQLYVLPNMPLYLICFPASSPGSAASVWPRCDDEPKNTRGPSLPSHSDALRLPRNVFYDICFNFICFRAAVLRLGLTSVQP